MSNTISISEQIHPITEKLLNGELSLSEVTLEDFDSGRIIYETAKKARCNGFDAEHLISTATQIKKYNSSHNTTYDPNDRETFQKLTGALDDRCFRLTKFEHIVRHYLKAQLDNYELSVFIGMKNFHYGKLNKPEKDTLESMIEWAETCKKASDNHNIFMKNRFEIYPDLSLQISKSVNTFVNSRSKEYWIEHSQKIKNGFTKESQLRRQQKIDLHKEEFRENVRKGVIKYYKNTQNAREKTSFTTKIAMNTPEMIDIRKRIKEDYDNQKKSLGEKYVKWNDFQKEWFIKNKESD